MVLWFACRINYYQHSMEARIADQPAHQAVCVEIREASGDRGHTHVSALFARTVGGSEPKRWSVVQLVDAVRAGERFEVGEAGGVSSLRPAVCGRCPMLTVASDPPDALARMPACDDGS